MKQIDANEKTLKAAHKTIEEKPDKKGFPPEPLESEVLTIDHVSLFGEKQDL